MEPVCGVWCLRLSVCVSHRVTYCDQVGRSKEQQTVVVTANNMRAEACLEEVVCVSGVCVCVCVCVSTCRCAGELCTCCLKY